MNFDAYWGTFRGDLVLQDNGELPPTEVRLFDRTLVSLCTALGADVEQAPYKLPGGFRETFQIVRNGDVIAHALTGGSGMAENTHQVRVQGAASPEVTEAFRAIHPFHGVSRYDVAQDYCAEGIFDQLVAIAEDVAKQYRVELNRVGAGWYEHQSDKGRTLNVGSRNSAVFLRLYERGKKLLAEGEIADPNYVRLELEVKPSSKAKTLLCSITADQGFTVSAWTSELARRLDIPVFNGLRVGTVWSPKDESKFVHNLARAFGKKLLEMEKKFGAEEVMRLVESAVTKNQECIRALRELKPDCYVSDSGRVVDLCIDQW